MFSLIITVVAIALVVALVGATMYWGGNALTQGRTSADAAAFVSGGQQISGAISMARAVDPLGATPTSIADLVTAQQLTGSPVVKGSGDWDLATVGVISHQVVNSDICGVINKQAGITPDVDGNVAAITGTYGCLTDGTNFTFQFKY